MYKLTWYGWILRLADNVYIPPDINNMDYVAYLAWLEEGNAPEPSDPAPW